MPSSPQKTELPPAAILCGGIATRLRTVSEGRPKSLIKVAGEPFIAHQLRLLQQRGISRVVLCVGFLGEEIASFVADGTAFGLTVEYSQDGKVLRGTGGALRNALPLLGASFFVLYGDSFVDVDLNAYVQQLSRGDAKAVMGVFRNENRWDKSNVALADGFVDRYDKSATGAEFEYIDCGLSLFKAQALKILSTPDPLDLAEIYATLTHKRLLAAHVVERRFYEIGSPVGLAETEAYLGKRYGQHK